MKPLAIDIDEFCKLTGVGRTKAYELINERQIARIKVGRRSLITYESAEAFIERLRGEAE